MANRNHNILIFLLPCVVFLSCQEIFTPDDLDNDKKIPVIQGLLTNNPGPYRVTLSWASPYSENNYTPIQEATVNISNNKGYTETLERISPGLYQTRRDGLRGTIGDIYTLEIILPDGTRYESSPALMNNIPVIDNIYAEVGKNKEIDRNYDGDIIVTEQTGLHVYGDMNSNSDATSYYRFNTTYYLQYTYSTMDSNGFPIPVYCLSHANLDALPNIKSTLFNGTEYAIRKHTIGFLPWAVNPYDSIILSLDGWITATTLFSINVDAFNYHQSIIDQLMAEGRIFDPVPTQIKGNMKCVTDANKVALGLFEVASVNIFYTTFYWGGGTVCVKGPLANYVWPGVDSCSTGIMPDYWVPIKQHNK